MFYGSPVTDPAQLASLRGPVQAHFGEKDDGIPPAEADAFRAALKQTGKEGEVYVYAGAGHAFMNETRPSYHADARAPGLGADAGVLPEEPQALSPSCPCRSTSC